MGILQEGSRLSQRLVTYIDRLDTEYTHEVVLPARESRRVEHQEIRRPRIQVHQLLQPALAIQYPLLFQLVSMFPVLLLPLPVHHLRPLEHSCPVSPLGQMAVGHRQSTRRPLHL